MKTNKKKKWIQILCVYFGVVLTLYAAMYLMQSVLTEFALPIVAVLQIPAYWIIAIVPFGTALISKDKIGEWGFYKKGILKQVSVGLAIAASMSLMFTVIPIFLGFKDWIGTPMSGTETWRIAYQFLYYIFAVGFVEEIVFRGYFYYKLLEIRSSKLFAMAASSIMFGLIHIFFGNLAQFISTALIGAIYCLCRDKIKGCSTLSLIVAHGVYDALIRIWSTIL